MMMVIFAVFFIVSCSVLYDLLELSFNSVNFVAVAFANVAVLTLCRMS